MVFSTKQDITNKDFEHLLAKTVDSLTINGNNNEESYLKLLGNKLEDEVFEVLNECARDSIFENTIELHSGIIFPDIIAMNYFGVEVKSTKSDKWKTTGNSVLESTRPDSIEKIYMLYGKMVAPIMFKCRPYSECLSEVKVTHSPRYIIDMELSEGKTIFDSINMPYDDLRNLANPIQPFIDYYRKKLKKGQSLWWLEEEDYSPESIYFEHWNQVDSIKRKQIIIESFVWFPELLAPKGRYDDYSLWLTSKKRVVCKNARDPFTAGGTEDYQIGTHKFLSISKKYRIFFEEIDRLSILWDKISLDDVKNNSVSEFETVENFKQHWLNHILVSFGSIESFKKFNLEKWLRSKITFV